MWDIFKYLFLLEYCFFTLSIVRYPEEHKRNVSETESVPVLTDPVFETFCSLEYRTMDDVQNPVIPSVTHHHQNPSGSTCLSLVLPEIFVL
jgi:hypothetical protein